MEDNTGYIVTPQNEGVLTHITGIPLKTLEANHGWVAHYSEKTLANRWALVPRSIAVQTPGFKLVKFEHIDEPAPVREPDEILAEMQTDADAYFKRRRELEAELDEAKDRKKNKGYNEPS